MSEKQSLTNVTRLRDDDMAYLMGMNTKDLHKLCGKLREDRLLAVYVPTHTPSRPWLT